LPIADCQLDSRCNLQVWEEGSREMNCRSGMGQLWEICRLERVQSVEN
jgi:hypothetical protein